MAYSDSPLPARMMGFASRQHGIIDARELAAAHVARSSIARWTESGRLVRLHLGVYSVVPPSMLTIEGRWLAAVKACGPADAFLSHGPAGQLGGIISRRERFAPHVSLRGRSHRKPPGIVVHRPRYLDPRDATKRLSIPTTTITRTVWDLASTLSPQQTRRAFERAASRDLIDRPRLAEFVRASPSRKGAGLVRTLLADRMVPLTEVRSWLEELLVTICADSGIPFPAVDVPLLGYDVDFLWESARFVVEADGGDHLEPTQRDRDNERDIVLGRAGYLVRRYSYRAMSRSEAVSAEILEILRERGALR